MLADSADYPITVAEIVGSLRQDPILLESAMGSGRTAELKQRLVALAHELPYPVYVALVSHPRDLPPSAHSGEDLAAALHTGLGKPGLYIVETTKERALTAQAFGIGLPGTYGLQADSNVDRLQDGMRQRHGEHQVYLAPAIDAEAAMKTTRHPIRDDTGGDFPFPQTLAAAEVDDLLDQQDELMTPEVGEEGAHSARIVAGTGVGVGLLLGIPLLTWLWRRQRRQLSAVRAERDRRRGLTTHILSGTSLAEVRRRAASELVTLAEELRDLPVPARHPEPVQQALLARDAAEILHRGDGPAAVIGALVLARIGRREVARAGQGSRAAYRPCFFDPLHGEASTSARWEYGEGDVAVPVCARCGAALRSGGLVTALALRGKRPYFEGEDVWARTGFGSLVDDFAGQILADRSSGR
jgi:hypothetical protein